MNLNILVLSLFPIIWCMPNFPPHSFEKRVFSSKKVVHDESLGDHTISVKKVFVTFIQGPYVFKKRREKGERVTFTCNGCQKVNKYLPVTRLTVNLSMMWIPWMVTRYLARVTTCVIGTSSSSKKIIGGPKAPIQA